MGEVHFYHLTRSPVETALRQLLEKALAAGWRAAVRGPEARLDWLDRQLWLYPEDGFLPHGVAGGPYDSHQPVLLTSSEVPENNPDMVLVLDSLPVSSIAVARIARHGILFDGADEQALNHARGQWADLTGAGCPARYWSQESGRWAEKAAKNCETKAQ